MGGLRDDEFSADMEHQPSMETAYIKDLIAKRGKHPTEVRCPEQCAEFRKILENMYVVHLAKNQDYSASNIGGTGEVGLATRIWDKVARLMNLVGFDIRTGKYLTPTTQPANESIDDTLIDLANYAVIAQIYRSGKWGR